MNNMLAIFIGGGIGSILRYGISRLMPLFIKTAFPIATLASNVFSCVALAAFLLLAQRYNTYTWIKPLLIIGFCGGFSTFSTFSLENIDLLRAGNYSWLLLNIFISVLSCIGLLFVLIKK